MNMQETILKKLHSDLYSLLLQFDVFCKKHNLRYSLTSGTLIGAIRENGFIPWDDDIDVMMPREDYEKFLDIANKEFNETDSIYKVEEYRNDENYTLFFAAFINTSIEYPIEQFDGVHKRKYYGIWIDVFPFDYINPSKIKKLFLNFYIRTITSCFSYKTYVPTSFINKLKISCSKILPKKWLIKKYENLVCKGLKRKNNNKKYNVCCFTFFRKNSSKLFYFDDDLFDNFLEHKFENSDFPIIKKYDSFLKSIFGDYMTPPKDKMQKPKHIEEKR